MTWNGWAMPDWKRLSWRDRLAWAIGSGFGSGFFPIAPGTVGSAAAAALYVAIMLLLPAGWGWLERLGLTLAMSAGGFAVGVWATGRMSTDANPDPGAAVWDEFVGMWLTLMPFALSSNDVVYARDVGATSLLVGFAFVSFRAMDILKPWPCRRLERLPGGWGIMLDDVAAGVWALLLAGIVVGALITFWVLSVDDFRIGGCC